MCSLPPLPTPNKNRVRTRKIPGRNHIIKQFKQMLSISKVPYLFYLCKLHIYEQFKKMSANCTFVNVCFFYLTQYAVTHAVLSVETPLGTSIA